MPFQSLGGPSLGSSLLSAGLKSMGITARVLYPGLWLARRIGLQSYLRLSELWLHSDYHQIGEWIFSQALFEPSEDARQRYLEKVLRNPPRCHRHLGDPVPEEFIESVDRSREWIEDFLDECLEEVLSHRPSIVGFSCMFQQQLASLALARRIKSDDPKIFTVLGGARCGENSSPELLRRFGFIDAIVSGEGDLVFPTLVRSVLDGGTLPDFPGVHLQGAPPTARDCPCTSTPAVQDMDRLPLAEFDDFFEQFEASGVRLLREPFLPLELSRGCWWGARSQCSYCGHNGAYLDFRRKSKDRALTELRDLAAKYPGATVYAADRVLAMDYFDDLLPALAERPVDLDLFFEVRPDLEKNQLRALLAAGVVEIQPGIESLSTPILRLMRRGVRAIENIQVLKWCREVGMEVMWNLLWDIPGEPPDEYRKMTELIPLLVHLPPPDEYRRVSIFPNSPYHRQPGRFGLTGIRPSPSWAHIFPFDAESVARLAHHFIREDTGGTGATDHARSVQEAIDIWRRVHRSSDLISIDDGVGLWIADSRPGFHRPLRRLDGCERLLYHACDSIRTARQLRDVLTECGSESRRQRDPVRLIQPMVDDGLMVREGDRFLALAIPAATSSAVPVGLGGVAHTPGGSEILDSVRQNALMKIVSIRGFSETTRVAVDEMRHAGSRIERGNASPRQGG
jgi:ribosomal peptide maturation radical SAM protein 1